MFWAKRQRGVLTNGPLPNQTVARPELMLLPGRWKLIDHDKTPQSALEVQRGF
jgi:hypothetical protein